MNTAQARRLIALHDNADRALANLRNAGAMSSDDPRAAEMLESAGDAYVLATRALLAEQTRLAEPSVQVPKVPHASGEAESKPKVVTISQDTPSDAASGPESASEDPQEENP